MSFSTSIILKSTQNNFLDKLVEENSPYETCALLLGKKLENQFIVEEIVSVENKDSSTVSFTMQDEKLLQLYAYSESVKLSVIGIFHSHPSEAYPSKTDKLYMEVNPVPWIIRSTITDEKRCFILNESSTKKKSQVTEIKINIRD